MAYAVEFAETALDDFEALIDSVPEEFRDQALDEVEARCLGFGQRPVFRTVRADWPPAFAVEFVVGGLPFRWAGTFRIAEDEQRLVVTHFFALPGSWFV